MLTRETAKWPAPTKQSLHGGSTVHPPVSLPLSQYISICLLQVSFGSILSPVGIGLMVYGFGAFFNLLPGGDVSSLLLIYGFPITVGGCAAGWGVGVGVAWMKG